MIQRGMHALSLSATGDTICEYHLEAAIAADDASTDWTRILALYDLLVTLTGSPVAALNRAVAVARVHGPQAGPDAANGITNHRSLESYHLFHAIRGALAAELGRVAEALTHFRMAGTWRNYPPSATSSPAGSASAKRGVSRDILRRWVLKSSSQTWESSLKEGARARVGKRNGLARQSSVLGVVAPIRTRRSRRP